MTQSQFFSTKLIAHSLFVKEDIDVLHLFHQMSVLLRKLTAAAMLSPQEASEEFRHAAVKSLKILFSGLTSCRRSSCGCRLSALPHCIISSEGWLKADIVSWLSFSSRCRSKGENEEDREESCEECLIEFLQSKNMSATVGHLLSIFLQVFSVVEFAICRFVFLCVPTNGVYSFLLFF